MGKCRALYFFSLPLFPQCPQDDFGTSPLRTGQVMWEPKRAVVLLTAFHVYLVILRGTLLPLKDSGQVPWAGLEVSQGSAGTGGGTQTLHPAQEGDLAQLKTSGLSKIENWDWTPSCAVLSPGAGWMVRDGPGSPQSWPHWSPWERSLASLGLQPCTLQGPQPLISCLSPEGTASLGPALSCPAMRAAFYTRENCL